MAIDRDDVEKIIAGVVGLGVVGIGIAALINAVVDGGETYTPTYDKPDDSETEDDIDDEGYEYADISSEDEVFEEDRIQREMDSMWSDHQADQIWEDYQNGRFDHRDAVREMSTARV